MAGARALPSLVPTSPDDPAHDANVAAWDVLRSFDRPFLCAFSDSDPITKGGERQFIPAVPGTVGQPHTTIAGGGQFLKADQGEQLAPVIADLIPRTRPHHHATHQTTPYCARTTPDNTRTLEH